MGVSGSVMKSIKSSGQVAVSPELQSMSDNFVTLTAMAVMEKPLKSVERLQARSKKLAPGFAKHEYVLINLTSGKYIKAEKLGNAKNKRAGIHINLVSDNVAGECRKKVNLMGITMQMRELLQILLSVRPDYNLFTSNCWKYAFRSAESLIRRCIADHSITASNREALKYELEDLLEHERKVPPRCRPFGLMNHSAKRLAVE